MVAEPWWRSLVAELILPTHGSGAWRRNSPISTHGSGAWWRGLVAELAPSTHGSGAWLFAVCLPGSLLLACCLLFVLLPAACYSCCCLVLVFPCCRFGR